MTIEAPIKPSVPTPTPIDPPSRVAEVPITPPVTIPRTAEVGPEMAALAPFYRDWTWTGTIVAGGMGPGSPEMIGTGRAVCRPIQDGLWYACDFEQVQRLLDGSVVLTWRLHWVTGWDRSSGTYRACSADNNGPTLSVFTGSLEGDRLVYESVGHTPARIRLTWILDDDTHARWRNEYTLDGLTWNLVEEYFMTVA